MNKLLFIEIKSNTVCAYAFFSIIIRVHKQKQKNLYINQTEEKVYLKIDFKIY